MREETKSVGWVAQSLTARFPTQVLGLIAMGVLMFTARPVSADLPDGLQYDDGFAYFRLANHGTVSNNVPSADYTLFSYARILGEGIAQGSALKFVVKKGRRALHTFTCQGELTYRHRMHPSNSPDGLSVAACTDRGHRFDATGQLSVEVYFIDDETDQEHLAATHTLDVRLLRQENHQGRPRPGHYFVNQHAFTAVAFIDQLPVHHQHMFSAVRGNRGSGAGQNEVLLHVHRSQQSSPGTLALRCSVNGERIQIPAHQVQSEQLSQHSSNATEVHRAGTSTEGDHMHWRRDILRLPLTWGDQENSNLPKLDDHPGQWDCQLRDDNRRTFREFSFTVSDGVIQPHPEEATGLHFPNGVHLVTIKVPADGPGDDRTDPRETRSGAFYGRRWQSSEARAMGGAIPRIGDAYPRSGRSRGRRR